MRDGAHYRRGVDGLISVEDDSDHFKDDVVGLRSEGGGVCVSSRVSVPCMSILIYFDIGGVGLGLNLVFMPAPAQACTEGTEEAFALLLLARPRALVSLGLNGRRDVDRADHVHGGGAAQNRGLVDRLPELADDARVRRRIEDVFWRLG